MSPRARATSLRVDSAEGSGRERKALHIRSKMSRLRFASLDMTIRHRCRSSASRTAHATEFRPHRVFLRDGAEIPTASRIFAMGPIEACNRRANMVYLPIIRLVQASCRTYGQSLLCYRFHDGRGIHAPRSNVKNPSDRLRRQSVDSSSQTITPKGAAGGLP